MAKVNLDALIPREAFEGLLLEFDFLIQQINRKYRTSTASYPYIKNYFFKIIELLNNGIQKDNVISNILDDPDFKYLTSYSNAENVTSTEFSRERKSAVYIKDAIKNTVRCKICSGYIHKNSMTVDHIIRKEDGGLWTIDNAQIAHP